MNTTSSGDSVSCVAQSDCRSTVAPQLGTSGVAIRRWLGAIDGLPQITSLNLNGGQPRLSA